jgi:hypothetical protein
MSVCKNAWYGLSSSAYAPRILRKNAYPVFNVAARFGSCNHGEGNNERKR